MALPFGLKSGLTAKTNVGIIGEDGRREDTEYSARCLTHGYRDWETDRKSTRLNSSHSGESRMPSSA